MFCLWAFVLALLARVRAECGCCVVARLLAAQIVRQGVLCWGLFRSAPGSAFACVCMPLPAHVWACMFACPCPQPFWLEQLWRKTIGSTTHRSRSSPTRGSQAALPSWRQGVAPGLRRSSHLVEQHFCDVSLRSLVRDLFEANRLVSSVMSDPLFAVLKGGVAEEHGFDVLYEAPSVVLGALLKRIRRGSARVKQKCFRTRAGTSSEVPGNWFSGPGPVPGSWF